MSMSEYEYSPYYPHGTGYIRVCTYRGMGGKPETYTMVYKHPPKTFLVDISVLGYGARYVWDSVDSMERDIDELIDSLKTNRTYPKDVHTFICRELEAVIGRTLERLCEVAGSSDQARGLHDLKAQFRVTPPDATKAGLQRPYQARPSRSPRGDVYAIAYYSKRRYSYMSRLDVPWTFVSECERRSRRGANRWGTYSLEHVMRNLRYTLRSTTTLPEHDTIWYAAAMLFMPAMLRLIRWYNDLMSGECRGDALSTSEVMNNTLWSKNLRR